MPRTHFPHAMAAYRPFQAARRLSGGAAYAANAVRFDKATSESIRRTTHFTGDANGTSGVVSFWFKSVGGVPGSNLFVTRNTATGGVDIRYLADGRIQFRLRNVGGTTILSQNAASVSDDSWHHVIASWDLTGTPRSWVYRDDVLQSSASTLTADTVEYEGGSWGLPALESGGSSCDCCLSEFYFNMAEFLDLSVEANRRKFITSGLAPVNLGTDGSTPTGTQPIWYMKDDAASVLLNSGSGGNFTIAEGTPSDCSDAP